MDVSIIIVNYNTCELIRNCLQSIYEQTKDIDFEVIVSDNGSKDGSIEMIKKDFRQVILIENNANLGFGTANNRGVSIAKGKYIFYLNSDTILLNNAIKLFFDYWENSSQRDKIGALGTNLLDADGNFARSYDTFPKPLNETFRMFCRLFIVPFCSLFHIETVKSKEKFNKYVGRVDQIIGADLFMLNNSNCKFDERFFLYLEESDLQWHLAKQKLDRFVIDGPQIIHLEGKSNSVQCKKNTIEYFKSFSNIQFQISRIKFQKYNRSKICAFLMKVLTYIFWSLPFFKGFFNQYKKELWLI